MASNHFIKDPDAVLDYKWDWDDWLEAGESISSRTVTVASGDVTVNSSSITDSGRSVTAWLSGGAADTSNELTCHIVTDAGREDDRTIRVSIRER